jgi:hypothetical protein
MASAAISVAEAVSQHEALDYLLDFDTIFVNAGPVPVTPPPPGWWHDLDGFDDGGPSRFLIYKGDARYQSPGWAFSRKVHV